MKFKFDPRAGRMVGSRTQILQRHEIERLGGVIPDNRHISPGTAYIPEKDVMRVKAAARRDGVEVTRLNDYDKDIGGGLYRFEKTTTFESRKHMKKINEWDGLASSYVTYRPGYKPPPAIGRRIERAVIERIEELLDGGHTVSVEIAQRGSSNSYTVTMRPAEEDEKGSNGIGTGESYSETGNHTFVFRNADTDKVGRVKLSQIMSIVEVDGVDGSNFMDDIDLVNKKNNASRRSIGKRYDPNDKLADVVNRTSHEYKRNTQFWESGKDMKINENTKVTLTLGQLKRLVKESKAWPKEIEYDDEEIDMPMSKPARGRSKAASAEAGPEDRILDLLEDIEAAGYNIVSPYSGSVGRRLYNVLGSNPKKADQDFQNLQDMVDAHDLTDVVRLRKSSSTSNAYYKYGITGRQAFSISWDNKYKAGLKELNQRKEDRKGSRLHMTSRYKDAHGKSGAAKSRHWQRQLGWLD